MFSYSAATKYDHDENQGGKQASDLFALVRSSGCLNPNPERYVISHIASCIEAAESPKRKEQYWALLVEAIESSSYAITPEFCSHISKLATRDIQVSPSCATAITCLVDRFVLDNTTFVTSLLPAIANAQPSTHLLQILRSLSAVRDDQQTRLHILHNLHAFLTSPAWKKHLHHFRPLLPTHPYSTKVMTYLFDSPYSSVVISFVLQVTSQSELSNLLQSLLTALLDRFSVLLSTKDGLSDHDSFSRYISTLLAILRLGTPRLSDVTTPSPQKKPRMETTTGSPLQNNILQEIFCVLETVFLRFSSAPSHSSLIMNVALCIRHMLRNCLTAIETRTPHLLDALSSSFPSSRQSYHKIHHVILTNLVSVCSESGRLPTLFSHFSARFHSEPFQFYAMSMMCTPQFSYELAKCTGGLSLEDASSCLRVLMPAFQDWQGTSALLSVRLACVTIESLMKGSSLATTDCVLQASSNFLKSKISQHIHVYWYFLSSLLILSSRWKAFAYTKLPDLLQKKGLLEIPQASEIFGETFESRKEARNDPASSSVIDSGASIYSLVMYLDEHVSKASKPSEIACFIRLSSVVFQIVLDMTRNDMLLLGQIGPGLLKKILSSYRRMCEKSYELALGDDLTPLWKGSALNFTSEMVCTLSGPICKYLDKEEYDDVFKHAFRNLINRNCLNEVQLEELMRKKCFRRIACRIVRETVDNLSCSEGECGDECSNVKMLFAMNNLSSFLDDKTRIRARQTMTRVRVKVTCEESKKVIRHLFSNFEVKGDSTTECRIKNVVRDSREPGETQKVIWKIMKDLISRFICASPTGDEDIDSKHLDVFNRLCVDRNSVDDRAIKMKSRDTSDGVTAILKGKSGRKLSREYTGWTEEVVVIMSDLLAAARSKRHLNDQIPQKDAIKEESHSVECKQDKYDDSSGLAAKLLTAYTISRSGIKSDERSNDKVMLIPCGDEDTVFFAKYAIHWIRETSAGQFWREFNEGEALALCCAIVKCPGYSRLDGDSQVNMACHLLYVVRQVMTEASEAGMEMCCEAVMVLEQVLNQLCRGGNRENVARPSEGSWRNLASALGRIVEAGMSRAQVSTHSPSIPASAIDGWQGSRHRRSNQRIAATLVSASTAFMQYGVGGRWFTTDTCCAAIRYANAMGGHACNEAVGHALKVTEWCRLRGMMSEERIVKLIMAGADAGSGEKVIEAIGSLMWTLPSEVVSTLLRQASPKTRIVFHLAEQHSHNLLGV